MKKVALILGAITIVALGYGIKRATAQQPVGVSSDPTPSQLAKAVRKARQSGFRGYQIVREEYLSCNGTTKHASTQVDMKDKEAGKYFGLDRLDGNKRVEIRKPDGTIIVGDQLSKRKMTFLPIPGRSNELPLASLLDPGTKCKTTFLGEEGIAGENLVSESDKVLGHPTFKVTHDSDDRIETKWYFSEPQYGCAVARMIMQFKDQKKPGTFASVSSQEATSVGPAPGPEAFNTDSYQESEPGVFAEEFAFARSSLNRNTPEATARSNAQKKAGTNPDVAEWAERYKTGRPNFK